MRYLLPLTSLLASVLALPLARRDVVDPPITSPTANTVWYVGQTATVTWNTTGLPVNQTNPVGRLVLGYWYNNSENLMLNSPLATNLNYSVGHAQITVPNVPTRTDYIVVLFGDSGNASPEFTIINDTSSSSVTPSPITTMAPGSPTTSTPAPASTPPPASTDPPTSLDSPNNVGESSPTSASGSPTSPPAVTAPSSETTTVHSSAVVTVTASAAPSSAQSSAAWQKKHVPGLGTCFGVSLALIYFAFS